MGSRYASSPLMAMTCRMNFWPCLPWAQVVQELGKDVDLSVDLAHLIGAQRGIGRSALASARRGVKIGVVTLTNQLRLLRSHQAAVMGADHVKRADSRRRSEERVSNCSTRKVSCEEEFRFTKDHITRLCYEVTSATGGLARRRSW